MCNENDKAIAVQPCKLDESYGLARDHVHFSQLAELIEVTTM
jgi:hypothetical protein